MLFTVRAIARTFFRQPSARRSVPSRLSLEELESRLVPYSTGPSPFQIAYTGAAAPQISFSADQTTVTIQNSAATLTLTRPVVSPWNFQPTGTIYWAAPNGNDQNSGDANDPFATISRAVAACNPGDAVYIRAGTYVDDLWISKSGTATSPIIVSAAPGTLGQVTITPSAAYVQANPDGAVITLNTADYIWINGLNIEGPLGRPEAPLAEHFGANGITLEGGAGLGDRITNNVVYDNVHCGIKEMGDGGSNFTVEGNIVFGNGTNSIDHGIYMPANNVTINGNITFDNTGDGIQAYSTPQNLVITHNLSFGNGQAGILLAGGNSVVEYNTSVYNYVGLQYFRGDCVNNVVENNIFAFNGDDPGDGGDGAWDNGGGAYGSPTNNTDDFNDYLGAVDGRIVLGPNDILGVDPGFTNALAGDFTATETQVAAMGAYAWPPAPVSVITNPLNLTYGAALADTQLSGSASAIVGGVATPVAGTFSFGSLAGTILGAGNYSETVAFTPTDSVDYQAVTAQVTLQVGQASPIATINTVNLVYGTALANSQLNGNATAVVGGISTPVAGTFTFGSLAGIVLGAGNYSERVTFTPTDSIDYQTVTTQVTVQVGQASPAAAVNNMNFTYGTALANSQLNGNASAIVGGTSTPVAGTFSFGNLAGTVLSAGSYSEAVTFTPADSLDYQTVTTQVTIQVGQASPASRVNAVNLVYGTALANSQLSGTATYTVNGQAVTIAGTFAYTSGLGTVLRAGNGQIKQVTFTPIDTVDYNAMLTTVSVNVARATPQIAVNPVNITYGTALANSQLKGTATFTVNGQVVKVAGTFTYTSGVGSVLAAGNGQIKQVTFTPTNTVDFSAVQASVTLNVARATPQVTVNSVNITYGTPLANSQLSGTATFIVNGKKVTVVGTYTYTSAAGRVLGIGNGQVEQVTFTPNDIADFNSVLTTVTVNVTAPRKR